jgi:hypothetical protein
MFLDRFGWVQDTCKKWSQALSKKAHLGGQARQPPISLKRGLL